MDAETIAGPRGSTTSGPNGSAMTGARAEAGRKRVTGESAAAARTGSVTEIQPVVPLRTSVQMCLNNPR